MTRVCLWEFCYEMHEIYDLIYINAEESINITGKGNNVSMEFTTNSTVIYTLYLNGNVRVLTVNNGTVKVSNTINKDRILADEEEDGNLSVKINSVVTGDAGRYCIKDMKTKVDIHCVDLIVTDVPSITLRNNTPPVLYQELNLTCEANSTTKPENHILSLVYSWFKDGIFHTTAGNTSILHDNNIDISYKDVNISCIVTDDPGCTEVFKGLTDGSPLFDVENDPRCINVSGKSKNFTVRPEHGPMNLSLSHRGDISIPVNVTCRGDCNPKCNTIWYRHDNNNNNNNNTNIEQRGEEIHISSVGNYTCFVSNKYGNMSESISVKENISDVNKTGNHVLMYVLISQVYGISTIVIIILLCALVRKVQLSELINVRNSPINTNNNNRGEHMNMEELLSFEV